MLILLKYLQKVLVFWQIAVSNWHCQFAQLCLCLLVVGKNSSKQRAHNQWNDKRSAQGYKDRAGDPLALFQDVLKGGLEKTVTHLVPAQGICSLSIDIYVSGHNRPLCFKRTTYSHGLEAGIWGQFLLHYSNLSAQNWTWALYRLVCNLELKAQGVKIFQKMINSLPVWGTVSREKTAFFWILSKLLPLPPSPNLNNLYNFF